MANGYDMKDLKRVLIDIIKDDAAKLSAKDMKDLLKLAMETELKLMQMSFENDIDDKDAKKSKKSEKNEDSDEDEDGNIVEFSLKAK